MTTLCLNICEKLHDDKVHRHFEHFLTRITEIFAMNFSAKTAKVLTWSSSFSSGTIRTKIRSTGFPSVES